MSFRLAEWMPSAPRAGRATPGRAPALLPFRRWLNAARSAAVVTAAHVLQVLHVRPVRRSSGFAIAGFERSGNQEQPGPAPRRRPNPTAETGAPTGTNAALLQRGPARARLSSDISEMSRQISPSRDWLARKDSAI